MYIGNIGHSQDFMGILKILKIIKEKKILKFIVIGDGRDKLRILEEVKRLNLEHHIYFLEELTKNTLEIILNLLTCFFYL